MRQMELILFHPSGNSDSSRMRAILESPRLSELFWQARSGGFLSHPSHPAIVIPSEWTIANPPSDKVQRPSSHAFTAEPIPTGSKECIFHHGRFVTDLDPRRIARLLQSDTADCLALQISPEALSYRERIRLTEDGRVAGFRRHYQTTLEPAPLPTDWPTQLWIRRDLLRVLSGSGVSVPLDYRRFLDLCRTMKADIVSFRIGGVVLDMESGSDLLQLLLSFIQQQILSEPQAVQRHPSARVVGPVLMGSGVRLAKDTVVVGPAILDEGVCVEEGAVVHQSILLKGQTVGPGSVVRNTIIGIQSDSDPNKTDSCQSVLLFSSETLRQDQLPYRRWPWYSYPRTIKRLMDILVSSIILTLFAPFFPIIALAITLNSRGPIFYRARRQGLYGRPFDCLKFRSMITTADSLQEKLRFINQVDGPQFKMDNDPRVSSVGRFLRATNLDEIPQFLNVLLGQMSIVGPRPSPDAENQLCPFWRYARLSVRPGITGLWQMMRTRIPARDFQEWVHYDTEYVRGLSLWMDASIAWMTAKKLIGNFFDQF
jgi:lipopolysaccharide/colanic/teichoic acid biosynthesis glycosyltransferase